MKYDLLLKGGELVDPAQGIKGVRDVAFFGGEVAAVEEDIPASQARQVVDVSGKTVTPGWIDYHVHAFWLGKHNAYDPDQVCPATGTTTVVDAGSAGQSSFLAFRRFVIGRSQTRIYAFLHISAIGIMYRGVPELKDLAFADPIGTARVALENRDLVCGIKVRIAREGLGDSDPIKALRLTREAAEIAGMPMMVHIGDSKVGLPGILAEMRPGDVVTHCYTGDTEGILGGDGAVLPEVWDAQERGIWMDVAHGNLCFSFNVARQAMAQGFLPHIISTDNAEDKMRGPVVDLPTTMSKFLALGMPLDDILARVTAEPARALGDKGARLGTLRVGAIADATVCKVVEGNFTFTDSVGEKIKATQRILPVLTVNNGHVLGWSATADWYQ